MLTHASRAACNGSAKRAARKIVCGTAGGFTLVELLVVIGIIALLISILLPSLNKARRSARAVQCSSNLRQVAMAMLSYINASKGVFPPVQVSSGSGVYPQGWWWANELVLQRYIQAPNLYRNDGPNGGTKEVITRSPFYCPEGIFEMTTSNNVFAGRPLYPTDEYNNLPNTGVTYQINGKYHNYPTWYMPNSRNLSTTNNLLTGDRQTAFVYYNNASDNELLERSGYSGWTRRLSLIRRPSEFCMILESNSNNAFDQGTDPNHIMRRLAARHGQKTIDGTNAYTNIAFFDGHVSMFPSARFDQAKDKSGQPERIAFYNIKQETIGLLNMQR